MGRELTRRHATLFERKTGRPVAFARDVYQYGKLRELSSFAVWELLHRLHLFPKRQYLSFGRGEVLSLTDERPDRDAFLQLISRHFSGRGLALRRSAHSWKLLFQDRAELLGCLYPDDRNLVRSSDDGATTTFLARFPERIKSLYVTRRGTLLVCVKGAVYRSSDGGIAFDRCLELGSGESFFRHNNEITETPDGTLLIGEYGNVWEGSRWRPLAYLYVSPDDGTTWERTDFLIGRGTNKHVHLVYYSTLFDEVFMADGDNFKKVWACDEPTAAGLGDPDCWRPINRFHIQMGGYTSVVETDGRLIFGTDYQGGTNFIVSTRDGKSFEKRVVPDPYRRSPIDNMVLRRARAGNEIWALLPYSTPHSKCLLMMSSDGGASWERMIEYDRAAHKVWLLNASRDVSDRLYFSVEERKSGARVVFTVSDA